jgi:predicted esterase
MQEHHLEVGRTARFATLGSLDQPPAQLWFVLHGHSQLATAFLSHFEILNDGRRLIVAPEGLSRFYLETDVQGRHGDAVGASWMTREDREAEIADYVAYLDGLARHVVNRLPGAAPSIRVLGFSQGAATAARWLARGSTHAVELVLWGGLAPLDVLSGLGSGAWRSMQVTVVRGSDDSTVPHGVLVTQLAQLGEHGIRCRALTFDGGHRLDDDLLATLARAAVP